MACSYHMEVLALELKGVSYIVSATSIDHWVPFFSVWVLGTSPCSYIGKGGVRALCGPMLDPAPIYY